MSDFSSNSFKEPLARFYRSIKAALKKMGAVKSIHFYHGPDERNPSGHGWVIDDFFDITFKRRNYGVRICRIDENRPLQVFVARIEGKEGLQNNYHVSFSSDHLDSYGILHVEPKLIRCTRGVLAGHPKRIGNYPALVSGTKSRYLIGKVDADFFPRIFAVADAKFVSLK